MIDREISISSFLALRFIEKPDIDFTNKYKYRRPEMPTDEGRILVKTVQEISDALEKQLKNKISNTENPEWRIKVFNKRPV